MSNDEHEMLGARDGNIDVADIGQEANGLDALFLCCRAMHDLLWLIHDARRIRCRAQCSFKPERPKTS
jgi:hypothetical protein